MAMCTERKMSGVAYVKGGMYQWGHVEGGIIHRGEYSRIPPSPIHILFMLSTIFFFFLQYVRLLT